MLRFVVVFLCVAAVAYGKVKPPPGPNPKCQTCCCGELFGDKWDVCPDRRFRCCGTTKYNPDKDTCCQQVLNVNFNEHDSRCCKEKAYDPRHYTCCHGVIVSATPTEDQCCDGVAYNQKREICCDGVLHPRGPNSRCCATQEYNPYNQICCKGKLTDGCTKDLRCCGQTGFDPHTHACLNSADGTLAPSPISVVGEATPRACGSEGDWIPCDDTCCPDGKGDFKFHPGVPVTHTTGCCSGHPYDIHELLCCAEELQGPEFSPKKHLCCHNNAYNPHEDTCCQQEGGAPNIVTGVGVCCGREAVFDPKNEICCGYQVFPGCPSRTKCCSRFEFGEKVVAPYDIKTQLCCDGYVRSGGKGWRCCEDESYRTKFENCCYGEVVQRSVFREDRVCKASGL